MFTRCFFVTTREGFPNVVVVDKAKTWIYKKNKVAKKGGIFCGIDLEIEIAINNIILAHIGL